MSVLLAKIRKLVIPAELKMERYQQGANSANCLSNILEVTSTSVEKKKSQANLSLWGVWVQKLY